MDHLAEGFRGGALAPAAMPWRSAASRSLPKAAKIISRFHDCPPSKRGHDTSPLYQGDVARHRIGIVCISGGRDGFGGVPPAQDSNVFKRQAEARHNLNMRQKQSDK